MVIVCLYSPKQSVLNQMGMSRWCSDRRTVVNAFDGAQLIISKSQSFVKIYDKITFLNGCRFIQNIFLAVIQRLIEASFCP